MTSREFNIIYQLDVASSAKLSRHYFRPRKIAQNLATRAASLRLKRATSRATKLPRGGPASIPKYRSEKHGHRFGHSREGRIGGRKQLFSTSEKKREKRNAGGTIVARASIARHSVAAVNLVEAHRRAVL